MTTAPRSLLAAFVLPLLLPTCSFSESPAACADAGSGWCLARRITGDVPGGELGFRFGEPLDVDGDRAADIAAGTRFKMLGGVRQNGGASIWSGRTGKKIREWEGEHTDGLMGHWVLAVPDVSGDRLADVVVAAPNARVGLDVGTGIVSARSPRTGKQIWTRGGGRLGQFGWDLSPAGDHNGDGVADIFAGAPSQDSGRAYLLSGKDGAVLQTYAPMADTGSFGWYVARLDDLDRDGRPDVGIGAYKEPGTSGARIGAAYVFSAATGQQLRTWKGSTPSSGFGEVIASLGDINQDGVGEIVVGSPRSEDKSRLMPGEVFVYSGADGTELRRWKGKQPEELYGRMVYSAGDVDGDRIDDLVIGAPWHRQNFVAKVGRVEIRSGRTGEVLHEMFGELGEAWFGWHIRRAPDPDGWGRPALLIGSLRYPVQAKAGTGVLDLWVLRKPEGR
ncbi:MAG TPA: integrin alpha [Candidatus Binatia bacterium]|nr:integrin alpha [Candidatus Binatia bacterium]